MVSLTICQEWKPWKMWANTNKQHDDTDWVAFFNSTRKFSAEFGHELWSAKLLPAVVRSLSSTVWLKKNCSQKEKCLSHHWNVKWVLWPPSCELPKFESDGRNVNACTPRWLVTRGQENGLWIACAVIVRLCNASYTRDSREEKCLFLRKSSRWKFIINGKTPLLSYL